MYEKAMLHPKEYEKLFKQRTREIILKELQKIKDWDLEDVKEYYEKLSKQLSDNCHMPLRGFLDDDKVEFNYEDTQPRDFSDIEYEMYWHRLYAIKNAIYSYYHSHFYDERKAVYETLKARYR